MRFTGWTLPPALVLVTLLCGCPDDSPDDPVPDASTPVADAAAPDTATADAFGADAAGEDAAMQDAGGADVAAADTGAEPTCSEAPMIDAVINESFNNGQFYVMDPAHSAVRFEPIAVAGQVGQAIVRLTSDSPVPRWLAQIVHLTNLDTIDVDTQVVDPASGDVYIGINMQHPEDIVRFYSADGSLAKEFVPEGEPGSDLVGGGRQSNLFVVRYSPSGMVEWVKRLGPNVNGDRAGTLTSLTMIAAGRVRVLGWVEDSTTLVFGPGEPDQLEQQTPGSSAFWAELDKTTGNYVSGSAVVVADQVFNGNVGFTARGRTAGSASGSTAFAGVLGPDNFGSETRFDFGNGLVVTSTTGARFLGKIGADNAVAWLRFVHNLTAGYTHLVASSPSGEVLFAASSSLDREVVFEGGNTGDVSITLAREDGVLALYSAGGDLQWVQAIGSDDVYPTNHAFVRDDGVYVVGRGGPGTAIPYQNGVFNLRRPGDWFLAKLGKIGGETEWVRVFGNSGTDAASAWGGPADLFVPASFSDLLIYGTGDFADRTAGSPTAGSIAGVVRLNADGDFVRCEAVATGMAAYGFSVGE